jgi:hypothetical protein
MTHIVRAAASAALIGATVAFVPAPAFAAGGAGVGRPAAFHGGFRPTFMRPLPGVPRAGVGFGLVRTPAQHRSFTAYRRGFGSVGVVGLDGLVAPYNQNAVTVVTYREPASSEPAPNGAAQVVMVYPRGCDAQTYTVPSERGGERRVTVRRCWSGPRLP